jgi:hypothetical protein
MGRIPRIGAIALTALSLGAAARADVVVTATDVATVQPGGPRSGSNGKTFFNMEGSSNGTFASFGVADFATTGLSPVAGLAKLTVTLTEANASFTAPGGLNFYLTTDTSTNIQPVTSPLKYQGANAPEGIGSQLGPKFLLGSGTFTSSGASPTGQVDTFSFNLTAPEIAYINGQIGVGPLRIVITPTTAGVAATFAGSTFNPSTSRPTLTLAVPEPGQLVQAGFAAVLAGGACALRRRKAA